VEEKHYSDFTGAVPLTATVGVASAELIPENFSRLGPVVVTNLSAGQIYLARKNRAVLLSGIPLVAYGSVMVDVPDTRGRIYKGPWYAIGSGAGLVVAISEE